MGTEDWARLRNIGRPGANPMQQEGAAVHHNNNHDAHNNGRHNQHRFHRDGSHHVDPIVGRTPVLGEKRRKLEQDHAGVDTDIATIDRELDDLCRRRRELVAKRRLIRRQLFVNLAKRGRRALDDGNAALPPLPHDPTWLYGRKLRAAVLKILAARGPLSLVEIHAQLHRLGCAIAHRHPVKALADALGYETELGRATRVARGVYQLVPGTRIRD